MEIVLASRSPRRRALLAQMGIKDFRVLSPDLDEGRWSGLPPAEQVRALSAEKAGAAAATAPGALVIAADTVVVLEGAVLGKPADEADAVRMLSALSGRQHQVYTGVTVSGGGAAVTEHEVTTVSFRVLSPLEIARYVKTGEPMDKAGAYGIQGYGALLVEGIVGDYFNVMGLPVQRLGRVLTRFGVDCLARAAESSAPAST
ncbi:MAG: septum formation protein Maf [Clostridiales bacterium]|nr:septum formation protein Maf [Clostridiales bacterium]